MGVNPSSRPPRARRTKKEKGDSRLPSPLQPQPARAAAKARNYFLPFFLAFFLALPLAFAFLLAAIVVSFLFCE